MDTTDDAVHGAWNNGLEPVLTVESGDVLEIECRDATAAHLAALDVDQVHALTGPVSGTGAGGEPARDDD